MAYNGVPTWALTPRQRIAQLQPWQRTAFRNYIAGAAAKPVTPPAPAPQAGATFVLPGSAEAEFGAQRSNIGETYTEETAANQYALANAQLAHQRDIRDQADQYEQTRGSFAQPYFARGLGASGIYRGDLAHLVQMRQRQMNDTRTDYTRQVAGLRLSREGIERRRALALANLRMKHQAALGDAAARSIR